MLSLRTKTAISSSLLVGSILASTCASLAADIIRFNDKHTIWTKYAYLGNGVQELVVHNRETHTMCVLQCRRGSPEGWKVVSFGPNVESGGKLLPK
jgi:hypothetical protein